MQSVLIIFTCISPLSAGRSFRIVGPQTVRQESILDQIVSFAVKLSQRQSNESERKSDFQTFSIQEVANFVSFVAIIVSLQSSCLSKNDICKTVFRNASSSYPALFRQPYRSIFQITNQLAINLLV